VGAVDGLKIENEVGKPVMVLWMKSLPELQAVNK